MQLEYYLKQPASYRLDFFELKNGEIPLLFPTICAFLNSDGGEIVIGMSREKEVKELREADIQDFIKKYEDRSLHHKGYLNPSRLCDLKKIKYKEGHIVVIDVRKSPVIHQSGEKYYIRDESKIKWVNDPQEIARLFSSRNIYTESEIVTSISRENLDLNLLIKARTIAIARNSNHRWLTMSDDEILNSSNLQFIDESTGKETYNLAAVLILGKESTIQRILPGYKLDVFIRKENVDRWDDRLTLSKNLIDTRIEALDFIKKHLPDVFYQEADQRVDLRDIIFREVVGNVIIHREYTDSLPTEIIINKEIVETTNPNIIHNKGIIDLNRFRNYPKNPIIRKFFNELGWSDEAGSGVRNVNKYLKHYSKGAIPTFIEDQPFITLIPIKTYLLGDRYPLLLDLFDITRNDIGEIRIKLLEVLQINPEIDTKENQSDFVLEFIGTLIKNEGKLNKVKLLKNNILKKEGFKMEGTLAKNGGNLFVKKGKMLMKILVGLLVEMTLEEILIFSGFESKESFRENYLKVLRINNLVELTIPDNPNAPNQKYVVTEKGKRLIGGLDI